MRCPSCNKFPGLEFADPEIQSEEFDPDTGQFSADVRIVRTSSCCGDEIKEATFSFDGEMPNELLQKHQGKAHELTASFSSDPIEEGGSRYSKSYFGATLEVTITCDCQKKEPVFEISMEDKINAAAMDELV